MRHMRLKHSNVNFSKQHLICREENEDVDDPGEVACSSVFNAVSCCIIIIIGG